MTHDEVVHSLCSLLGPSWRTSAVTRRAAGGASRSEVGIVKDMARGARVEIAVPDAREFEPEFLARPSAAETYQVNVYQDGALLGTGHIRTTSMLEADASALVSHLGR